MKKGTKENPARMDRWFVLGTAFVGEVSNHPRQEDFNKPLQQAFPQERDLRNFLRKDTFITDAGVHFVLGDIA